MGCGWGLGLLVPAPCTPHGALSSGALRLPGQTPLAAEAAPSPSALLGLWDSLCGAVGPWGGRLGRQVQLPAGSAQQPSVGPVAAGPLNNYRATRPLEPEGTPGGTGTRQPAFPGAAPSQEPRPLREGPCASGCRVVPGAGSKGLVKTPLDQPWPGTRGPHSMACELWGLWVPSPLGPRARVGAEPAPGRGPWVRHADRSPSHARYGSGQQVDRLGGALPQLHVPQPRLRLAGLVVVAQGVPSAATWVRGRAPAPCSPAGAYWRIRPPGCCPSHGQVRCPGWVSTFGPGAPRGTCLLARAGPERQVAARRGGVLLRCSESRGTLLGLRLWYEALQVPDA